MAAFQGALRKGVSMEEEGVKEGFLEEVATELSFKGCREVSQVITLPSRRVY